MSTPTADTSLNITRTFTASPEAVFDAFSSVDAMKQWFGPDYCHVTHGDMDFQEGGAYHLHLLINGEEKKELVGTFQKINRPSLLQYTWAWIMGPDEITSESTVKFTFKATESGTEMHMEHVGLADTEIRDHHNVGWGGSFDNLEETLSAGA